jgi:hypothetical protein
VVLLAVQAVLVQTAEATVQTTTPQAVQAQ